MPKASFRSQDTDRSGGEYTKGDLSEVVEAVSDYLQENAGEDAPASSYRTDRGLHIRVGGDAFIVAPYSGPTPVAISDASAGLYSFAELKGLDLPAPEPIVEGFLNKAETALLAGRGKVGKSRLTQQLAVSIVTGSDFLGMPIRTRGRVLIVDLENRTNALRDRLLKMAGSQTEVRGLFVWCASSLSDDTIDCSDSGIERLRGFIDQTRADVLIIDPWRLFLGKDENNAEDVVSGLRRLSRLRQDHPSLAIVIVHHVRKDRFENPRSLLAEPRLWTDAVSGHHALSAHVDACFGLERQRCQPDDEELIVFGGVARNTEPRTILLGDDEETLRFTVECNAEALEMLLTTREKQIWERAKQLGKFTFSMLFKEAGTKNKKAVSAVLKKACAQGLLKHEDKTYTVLAD